MWAPLIMAGEIKRTKYHPMADNEHDKTGPSATIDAEGLRRFIRDRKLGDASDLRTENISFGHSNEVHLIHF
ncbi:MAG TPA: hypothetical protein VMF50_07125, partial [Candidatus Binataceae bacterium]|nr:hypothetical protein [Candidatus Binataceae bacterium]